MLNKFKGLSPEDYMSEMKKLSVKTYLTTTEASEYFNIGSINLIKILDAHPEFVFLNGRKRLVHREKFSKYLETERLS